MITKEENEREMNEKVCFLCSTYRSDTKRLVLNEYEEVEYDSFR